MLRTGLAKEQGEEYAAYIDDWLMPEMNGIATLELIRQDEAIRESKVMILAASIDDGMKEKADQLGVAGYAGKPLMPAQLQAKVAEAFA